MDGFLLAVLPLVVFVVLDIFQGAKQGIYGAIILSALLFVYFSFIQKSVDWLMFGEFILILGFGVAALKLNESKYFKLQPAVMGYIIALVLAGFQIAGKPFLIFILPHLAEILPQLREIQDNPAILYRLRTMSHYAIYVFLFHSSLTAYAAFRLSTKKWLGIRLLIYPLILVLSLVP